MERVSLLMYMISLIYHMELFITFEPQKIINHNLNLQDQISNFLKMKYK